MDYQQAVFASPSWGARRDATGEFIEFSSQTDKWVYTWPRQGVQFDYDRLADWAEDMPDTARGHDWRPLVLPERALDHNARYGKKQLHEGKQLQEVDLCSAYPKHLDP